MGVITLFPPGLWEATPPARPQYLQPGRRGLGHAAIAPRALWLSPEFWESVQNPSNSFCRPAHYLYLLARTLSESLVFCQPSQFLDGESSSIRLRARACIGRSCFQRAHAVGSPTPSATLVARPGESSQEPCHAAPMGRPLAPPTPQSDEGESNQSSRHGPPSGGPDFKRPSNRAPATRVGVSKSLLGRCLCGFEASRTRRASTTSARRDRARPGVVSCSRFSSGATRNGEMRRQIGW